MSLIYLLNIFSRRNFFSRRMSSTRGKGFSGRSRGRGRGRSTDTQTTQMELHHSETGLDDRTTHIETTTRSRGRGQRPGATASSTGSLPSYIYIAHHPMHIGYYQI